MNALPEPTRSGIATFVGKPNAGKSTLLNRIIGQKLSIVSPKPQSTRDRIVGIHTEEGVQMVIFDTPGLLTPKYALQAAMRGAALMALDDADVVVYLHDASEGPPPPLVKAAELDHPPRGKVLLALNKVDTLSAAQRARLAEEYPDAHQIVALTGEGVPGLMQAVRTHLPVSPYLYPEDEISTQSTRFFASELIRETALEQLDDEVPYSVACEIEEFRESRTPVYIRAVIFVERDSQKGILIGAGGARIRDIGRISRTKIESLIESPVYLDLRIKVLPNWRKKGRDLRRFGYKVPEEKR